ncbi:MAG: GTP cyclohydrolase II [Saprospiraceae bacterium]|jgi:GTP cyclohydrolase II
MGNRGTKQQAEALLPTDWGTFIVTAHSYDSGEYTPHIVLRHPELDVQEAVCVRVHSECVTGDIFHSQKCDCGKQLSESMKLIAQQKGLIIYLRQEGRGIGIINKLKAYRHQEDGMDTIEANHALGLETDYRGYEEAAIILKDLGIEKVKLITNNPLKIRDLEKNGITVASRIPIIIPAQKESINYLKTKEDSMGHLLNLKETKTI